MKNKGEVEIFYAFVYLFSFVALTKPSEANSVALKTVTVSQSPWSNFKPVANAEVAKAVNEPISSPESESHPETTEEIPAVEQRPSAPEILLPAISIGLGILIGLFVLSLYTHKCRGTRLTRVGRRVKVGPYQDTTQKQLCKSNFLSPQEKDIILSVSSFYNKWWTLLVIALPCCVSLFFCPLVLFLHPSITNLFWSHLPAQPDVNEAIGCFLGPAGMVYAVSFGFTFQQAMGKQHEVRQQLQDTKSNVKQLLAVIKRLSLPEDMLKLDLYTILKTQLIVIILRTQGNRALIRPTQDMTDDIWRVIDILRHVTSRTTLDSLLTRRIMKNMSDLVAVVEKMDLCHINIHIIEWVFLETLGYFTFLGVLLLRAQSPQLELALCVVTVVSISLLCYIVSDLDYPFDGFFRVDLDQLLILLCDVQLAVENLQSDTDKKALVGFDMVQNPQRSISQFSARVVSP